MSRNGTTIKESVELLSELLPIRLRFGDFEELKAKIVLLGERESTAQRQSLLQVRVQYPAANNVLLPPAHEMPYIWDNLNTFAKQAFCDAKALMGEERYTPSDKPQYIYYKSAEQGWVSLNVLLPVAVRKGAVSLKDYLRQEYGTEWLGYLPAQPEEDASTLCTEVTCKALLQGIDHLVAALPDRAMELLKTTSRMGSPYDKWTRLVLPSSVTCTTDKNAE